MEPVVWSPSHGLNVSFKSGQQDVHDLISLFRREGAFKIMV